MKPPKAAGRKPAKTNLPALVTPTAIERIQPKQSNSLNGWVRLYCTLEAGANAPSTFLAKVRDLRLFLTFLQEKLGSDHPDQWTKSVTAGFLRHLENTLGRKPTTVNRVLATLRHCANWIHHHRAFLASNPADGIKDLVVDEPEWKGLSDLEVMRLKSAAEQLVRLKAAPNQHPVRDQAIFLVLLNTGLRVSELAALDRRQHEGKHLTDVKRKGKVRTAKVFLPTEAREALDRYLELRGGNPGPLLCSRSGQRLERQHVDRLVKQIAAQANAHLRHDQRIQLSAHILRHTFLRKVAEKRGVHVAMEVAGHTSSKYIWRYVKPSEAEKEKALEGLFWLVCFG